MQEYPEVMTDACDSIGNISRLLFPSLFTLDLKTGKKKDPGKISFIFCASERAPRVISRPCRGTQLFSSTVDDDDDSIDLSRLTAD